MQNKSISEMDNIIKKQYKLLADVILACINSNKSSEKCAIEVIKQGLSVDFKFRVELQDTCYSNMLVLAMCYDNYNIAQAIVRYNEYSKKFYLSSIESAVDNKNQAIFNCLVYRLNPQDDILLRINSKIYKSRISADFKAKFRALLFNYLIKTANLIDGVKLALTWQNPDVFKFILEGIMPSIHLPSIITIQNTLNNFAINNYIKQKFFSILKNHIIKLSNDLHTTNPHVVFSDKFIIFEDGFIIDALSLIDTGESLGGVRVKYMGKPYPILIYTILKKYDKLAEYIIKNYPSELTKSDDNNFCPIMYTLITKKIYLFELILSKLAPISDKYYKYLRDTIGSSIFSGYSDKYINILDKYDTTTLLSCRLCTLI